MAVFVALVALDRLLLRLESRGWINYRRNRLGRGGGLYHMLELHSIYEPGMRQIAEAKYREEQEDSGTRKGGRTAPIGWALPVTPACKAIAGGALAGRRCVDAEQYR